MTGQHIATLATFAGTDDFELYEVAPTMGTVRLMQLLATFVAVDLMRLGEQDNVLRKAMDTVTGASAAEILGALRFD